MFDADKNEILLEAVANTASKLGLEPDAVSFYLPNSASEIDPKSEMGQRAMRLIRVYRSLHTLLGGNEQHIQHWMKTQNRAFNAIPSEMIRNDEGLNRVLEYVDAIRGKV